MAPFAQPIAVEGLRDLRRDLRRMDKGLLAGVREGIKDAAQLVAREAQRRGPRGRTSRLVASIRPRVRGDVGLVVATAVKRSPRYPAGFPYPRRLEFEDGGRRAFMAPALEAKRGQVERRLEHLLDDIGDVWEKGD